MPEMEIMKQILKAKKHIDFAVFTFAQSSGIDDALISIFDSFNNTKPANCSNDENIVIVGELDETRVAQKSKQKRIAVPIRKEINRIIDDFGE